MEQNRPQPVYLDTAASTGAAPEVAAAISEALRAPWGVANGASAEHALGRDAADAVDSARRVVARELRCEQDEVIFTSGATESINLALQGIATANAAHGTHLLTTAIEHQATLACCEALERRGFEVSYLKPQSDGRIAPQAVAEGIRPDTLIVSVMHINNETGAIQPIKEVAAIAAEAGVLLHLDAAQSAGKFEIDLQELPIDLLSLSAHKFHGPKGVGCLIIRNRARTPIAPLCFGGGQEYGLRPGTLATHQIIGLATALQQSARRRTADFEAVQARKARLIDQLQAALPLQINGDSEQASPYILNLSIAGITSDALINQTASEIAIASGSACSSGTIEPSRVLRAMGIEGERLHGAVRISFDPAHTEADIDFAADAIARAVARIRTLDA